MSRRIDPEIQAALDATRLPYTFEDGGRHLKIKIGNRLAGVLSRGAAPKSWREAKNTVAQIRRLAKEIQNATN